MLLSHLKLLVANRAASMLCAWAAVTHQWQAASTTHGCRHYSVAEFRKWFAHGPTHLSLLEGVSKQIHHDIITQLVVPQLLRHTLLQQLPGCGCARLVGCCPNCCYLLSA
eukprot:GHRQ01019942.1.p1 GENE.GHRQ01019942.1~~GHRQ01019942.1.p1  ORF type:complete len:110 (+),score=11.48 GHRQ01019942.1:574-903(+)